RRYPASKKTKERTNGRIAGHPHAWRIPSDRVVRAVGTARSGLRPSKTICPEGRRGPCFVPLFCARCRLEEPLRGDGGDSACPVAIGTGPRGEGVVSEGRPREIVLREKC